MFHDRAAYELQLVELDAGKRQFIGQPALVQHHLSCLARETEYEMGSDVDASACGGLDRLPGAFEVVPAVDVPERLVIAGLDAVFDGHDLPAFVQRCDVVEFGFVDAVRPGADDQPDHVRMAERFFVETLELAQRTVGVGVSLEISEVVPGVAVADAVEFHAFLHLLRNAFGRVTIGRIEGSVGAKVEEVGEAYINAKALSEKAAGPIKIHIKLDTGMRRIGFRDAKEAKEACSLPNLVPEGVFTHFASADEGENGREFTRLQYERFMEAVRETGVDFEIKHVCNSAGILDYPEYHLDMVRAGIILYGLKPSEDVEHKIKLVPAMTLRSVVSQVKTIRKGDVVSYGRTFTAPADMKVATIPAGYADGYWRSNSDNGTRVIVNGVPCRILGRVCMDQLMVDAGEVKELSFGEGSDVELFGKRMTADTLAANNGTINYEVLCGVGARVPRIYVGED